MSAKNSPWLKEEEIMKLSIEVVISIVSAIMATTSLIFSLYIYFSTVRHDRRRDTLEAYNVLQEQSFDKLNQYMPAQIKEIAKNKKSEEYKIIIGYVARIEHFCVGINEGIYDRNTLFQLAHGYLDGSVIKDRILPIIENKKGFYENTEKVLVWMEREGKKKSSQKHSSVRE